MTATALAILIACLIGLVGLGLLLFNVDRGNAEVSTPGGFNLKGGVGLAVLVIGFGGAGYLLYHPVSPNVCLVFCPTTVPPQSARKFDFPDQDTLAGNGLSGHMTDVHVTLLPPDEKHPLGQFIATWKYTGAGGGSQKGSQSVDIRMKGKGDVDLPSPAPLPLDRSACHYGGVRQTFQQDLETSFDTIQNVQVQPGILEGKVGRC